MNNLQKAIKKYNIDIIMMGKTKKKQNMVNVSKMERQMKKISREAQIIIANSKEQSVKNTDYLPGGIMMVFQRDVNL